MSSHSAWKRSRAWLKWLGDAKLLVAAQRSEGRRRSTIVDSGSVNAKTAEEVIDLSGRREHVDNQVVILLCDDLTLVVGFRVSLAPDATGQTP